ncbi:hypothetical protein ACWGQ5_36020 [Streptomyces sp. NPDC055722]
MAYVLYDAVKDLAASLRLPVRSLSVLAERLNRLGRVTVESEFRLYPGVGSCSVSDVQECV